MVAYPGFISGSYTSQSPLASQDRTVNWYPERLENQSESIKIALYPTPGVVTRVSGTVGGGGRAHAFIAGREFCIIGSTLYEVSSSWVMTNRGTVSTDLNPATISTNGDGGGELFITSGANGYVYTLATNVLAAIANLAGKATMGDQLDGYFIALDAATSTVYLSDLNDGTTWDPTQFIQRSIESDSWISMKTANRYIYLFGSKTSEVWFDAGSFPIPFEPHPSGLMQFGCSAPFSPKVVGNSIAWLGSTANGVGLVLRTSGFVAEEVSTYAIHWAIENYSTLSDAIGDTYEAFGHKFYILTFQTADATWVWDAQMNMWHERGLWSASEDKFKAWRPLFHVFAFDQHRVLDFQSESVLQMSSDYFLDVGEAPLRRLRRAPAIVKENTLIFYSQFELDLEPGLGAVSGQGVAPLVMMRTSNDGGKTWSSYRTASAGALGVYGNRSIWNRCGAARRRVFEVSVSDPIAWRILDAYLRVSPGSDQA